MRECFPSNGLEQFTTELSANPMQSTAALERRVNLSSGAAGPGAAGNQRRPEKASQSPAFFGSRQGLDASNRAPGLPGGAFGLRLLSGDSLRRHDGNRGGTKHGSDLAGWGAADSQPMELFSACPEAGRSGGGP